MHLCDIKLYQTAPNKKTQIQAHENDDNIIIPSESHLKLSNYPYSLQYPRR